uniref:KS1 protein n=1 Tax=Solanum tuberosum TaxID=4113 RepID=M1A6X2_SOLTU
MESKKAIYEKENPQKGILTTIKLTFLLIYISTKKFSPKEQGYNIINKSQRRIQTDMNMQHNIS